tara:strand:+ start:353 stop:463 length:111 start_codon:yes stop_codon:yes gene_type:complete
MLGQAREKEQNNQMEENEREKYIKTCSSVEEEVVVY